MKKKISIIGAGITGIYCAILLSNSGHEVEVYEANDHPGGILRDIEFNNDVFFKACQLLDSETKWFKELKKISSTDFDIFEPSYGSYVDFNGEEIFSNKFSIPIFRELNVIDISKLDKNYVSLDERISLYNKSIKKFLLDYICSLGLNANEISGNCAANIQINRISSKEDQNLLTKIKLESKIYDEIYAVEPEKLNIKYSVALPKNGFSNFFDKLVNSQKKIKFYYNSKIFPKWSQKKLLIELNKKKINSDIVVWTGNPTLLINSFSHNKMKSSIIRVRQLNFNLKYSSKSFFYTQVFSINIKIYRIYLYKLNGISKISIEMIRNKDETNIIIKDIKKILSKFNIKIDVDLDSCVDNNFIRHDITSLNDLKLIKQIRLDTENSRLICSPWDIYSRDKKIETLVNKLNEKKLLK
jgi:hypothetical protein